MQDIARLSGSCGDKVQTFGGISLSAGGVEHLFAEVAFSGGASAESSFSNEFLGFGFVAWHAGAVHITFRDHPLGIGISCCGGGFEIAEAFGNVSFDAQAEKQSLAHLELGPWFAVCASEFVPIEKLCRAVSRHEIATNVTRRYFVFRLAVMVQTSCGVQPECFLPVLFYADAVVIRNCQPVLADGRVVVGRFLE